MLQNAITTCEISQIVICLALIYLLYILNSFTGGYIYTIDVVCPLDCSHWQLGCSYFSFPFVVFTSNFLLILHIFFNFSFLIFAIFRDLIKAC